MLSAVEAKVLHVRFQTLLDIIANNDFWFQTRKMPKYRLVYFNMRGRAEPIRWMFKVAKQPFEDERFDKDKEWPSKKEETPYGKVPILYVDDKPLSQSVGICRYLGKLFELYSEDPWNSSIGDEVADSVHDLLPHAAKVLYTKLAGDKAQAQFLAEEFNNSVLRVTLKQLETRLQGRPWFCGEKMTWVDIFATCYLSQLIHQNKEAFSPYPKVRSVIEKVMALPEIEKWLKERPVTSL